MVEKSDRLEMIMLVLYYLKFRTRVRTYPGEIATALLQVARSHGHPHVAIYYLSPDDGPELLRQLRSDLSQLEDDGLVERPNGLTSVNLSLRGVAMVKGFAERKILFDVAAQIAEYHYTRTDRLIPAMV